MSYAELKHLRHRIQPGAPLPFNVRDADRTLLLARGQHVETTEQLEALLQRGALVDLAELRSVQDEVRTAPRRALPGLWSQCMDRLSETLLSGPDGSFRTVLEDASAPVQALIERDPDLAIFQVLRHGGHADTAYGAHRALQTAITGYLVAQRLGWEPDQCQRLFKVALTANVSMLALQGELARQKTPPTPAQRAELQTHPMRSVRVLQQAGVADAEWLHAVLHHHEQDDGGGYPGGQADPGDLATLARRADLYTSKLASRATRDALSADLAGRQMFMQDPGHPMTTALVREFGIYPPGSFVRLACGALALVVQRGPAITHPVVACLTTPGGHPLAEPQRLQTTDPAHAVVAVVGERSLNLNLSLDRLAALVTA